VVTAHNAGTERDRERVERAATIRNPTASSPSSPSWPRGPSLIDRSPAAVDTQSVAFDIVERWVIDPE